MVLIPDKAKTIVPDTGIQAERNQSLTTLSSLRSGVIATKVISHSTDRRNQDKGECDNRFSGFSPHSTDPPPILTHQDESD
ncbi:hypothetical protein BX666DRAFT_2125598 [Dichotomocladium elegans]|nr:hypothetical protein BX666DRAFT_2125598 [Dichotomocladium elegans]